MVGSLETARLEHVHYAVGNAFGADHHESGGLGPAIRSANTYYRRPHGLQSARHHAALCLREPWRRPTVDSVADHLERAGGTRVRAARVRSEEHTSELQSLRH